jgi:hypothetical protein
MSKAEKYVDQCIADSYGVEPHQLTTQLFHEMNKRIENDPSVQFDYSTEYVRDTNIRELTEAEEKVWQEKKRRWAREIIQSGPTFCGAAVDLLERELRLLEEDMRLTPVEMLKRLLHPRK